MTAPALTFRALYGLSRGTQAALSVAQPLLAMVAAAAAAGPPPAGRLLAALLAAFAGYAAVFAANDLIDARVDRADAERRRAAAPAPAATAPPAAGGFDIDGAGTRHPIATGRLPYGVAVAWVVLLSGTALTLAARIDAVCAVLFLAAALLEAGYCALARVTPYKTLLSGLMVAVGAAAGWFVVTRQPDWPLLVLFCVWMAAWEIGGRNVPNDWADVDDDRPLGIRTVPVVHGPRAAGAVVVVCLTVTSGAGVALFAACAPAIGPAAPAGAAVAGAWALLWPATRLLRAPGPDTALALFNRASLYPALVLFCALVGALTGGRAA
ncbi:UbiA family prenyltransferase [Streptomyces sp. RFCAC02]|uniref:UbiA family prenyltransferase n=1 Tax=Streptomyces sp. RFCAC02 TaxID=2499143 RepID=UPI001F0ED2F0|nr:UbiA family prenyltransferase [Streptomyces sp. RFCAC02]